MSAPDRFACTVTLRFDPWGLAADDALDVLLPLPADDGYQRVLHLDAPPGRDIADAHGRRRLIRLERGRVASVTARIETRRIVAGAHLDLPPPGPADLDAAPLIVPDDAVRTLAARSTAGVDEPGARIAELARAAAAALRYRYPREGRGAALSLDRGWGDCGEYAFVFVALCRVLGIPARPVFGLITAPWMATPHAWAEAWDGVGWQPVDPNLVREGAYLGPILDTGTRAQDHVGALDPYRLVLSRHTGLPWPGDGEGVAATAGRGPTAALDGLGRVTFWHEAPRWGGRPVVPFLQMPWTVIRRPATAGAWSLPRRASPWRFAVRRPSRRLPRDPLALADLVALHPAKGMAVTAAATLALHLAPAPAPLESGAIWLWLGLLLIGTLRQLRLVRLRSATWMRVAAALRARRRPSRPRDPGRVREDP
ncbi:transglutaminase domain-containing protein [Salinarimonas chemoclinalis]|uniref:transglutaminase domain-containing protein n=1 Tax=Salinarimonas chemoclinalis TaxID=3241599 RepID=UPI003558839D